MTCSYDVSCIGIHLRLQTGHRSRTIWICILTTGKASGLRLHFRVSNRASVAARVGPSLMSASLFAKSRPADEGDGQPHRYIIAGCRSEKPSQAQGTEGQGLQDTMLPISLPTPRPTPAAMQKYPAYQNLMCCRCLPCINHAHRTGSARTVMQEQESPLPTYPR